MVFDYTHYTGTSTASDVWPTWVQSTTATTTSTATWYTWVAGGNSWAGAAFDPTAQLAQAAYGLTQRQFGQQHAERVRLAQQAHSEAHEKARELLLLHLSPEQQESYERGREFLVEAASGKLYRIGNGIAGNVEELDEDGCAVAQLCIHTHEGLPVPDNQLAQKLWLEWDEEEFCRVANRTELRRRVAA